jgi:1-acyl-sn-glycerol-3-phosphate acyltransferase
MVEDGIAKAFIGALVVGFLANGLRLWRERGGYNRWEALLYGLVYVYSRLMWRVQVMGQRRFAADIGAVIVANHRSSIDPCFIQLAAGRRVHWMVAGEYCRHFFFGPILKLCQVIPTNRGGVDTAATKQAMRLTREGRLVGMFPEGRINRTSQPLLTIRPGAALVGLRAGVPLIPVWIEGSPQAPSVWEPLFKPARVRITIGPPMVSPTAGQAESDSTVARAWILEVMDQVMCLGKIQNRPTALAQAQGWSESA